MDYDPTKLSDLHIVKSSLWTERKPEYQINIKGKWIGSISFDLKDNYLNGEFDGQSPFVVPIPRTLLELHELLRIKSGYSDW